MLNQRSKPTLYKAVQSLNISSAAAGELRLRLDKELEIIERHKLWSIFKRKQEDLISLDDVVATPELSVVGYLSQSLSYEQRDEERPIDGIDDFLSRLKQVQEAGGGTLQEPQILDLIAHRVFGPPQKAYKAYWKKAHPGEVCPPRRFPAVTMFDSKPVISLEQAVKISGLPVNKSIDFEDSSKLGHNMHYVGWLVSKPAIRNIKRTQKDMASFDILPVDTVEDKIPVVCWPEHLVDLRKIVDAAKADDLVSVVGLRAYNQGRKERQLELRALRILEVPDEEADHQQDPG